MMTDAGEELLLSLLLRGLTLRLYSTAHRNGDPASVMECDFDGYDAVKLDEDKWQVTRAADSLEATYPKISFECSIPKRGGVEVAVSGYYLTRGTTTVATCPFSSMIECRTPGLHRIDVTPQFVSRDNAKQE